MTAGLFRIQRFTGEDPENENPARFIGQIEYSFAPMASQYTKEGLQVDMAKALFLQSYTSLTAEK